MLFEDAVHPHIHRQGLQPVVAEERHALGHLDAHTADFHQCFPQLIGGPVGQRLQVQFAAVNAAGRVIDIAGPVAEPAFRQPVRPGAHQRRRGGESPALRLPRVEGGAAGPAEFLDGAADGRDAFALGDDEADEHLPGVLAQNAQPGAVAAGRLQVGVPFEAAGPEGRIVGIQVKISPPEGVELRPGAGKHKGVRRIAGPDLQIPAAGDQRPAGRGLPHTEALTACGNGGGGKIGKQGVVHGAGPLCGVFFHYTTIPPIPPKAPLPRRAKKRGAAGPAWQPFSGRPAMTFRPHRAAVQPGTPGYSGQVV